MLRRWVGALVSLEDGISLERKSRTFLFSTLEREILQPARFLLQHLDEEDDEDRRRPDEEVHLVSSSTQRKRRRQSVMQQSLGDASKQAPVASRGPWSFLRRNLATKPMQKNNGFWSVNCDHKTSIDSLLRIVGSRSNNTSSTIDDRKAQRTIMNLMAATAHVAQSGCGTAVHIGEGRILTAAHVVEKRSSTSLPQLLLLVFPKDRNVGLAQCVAKHDAYDVAVLKWLGVGTACTENGRLMPSSCPLEAAEPKLGEPLLCIGNPCNIDLESSNEEELDLQPKVWHASLGQWKGRVPKVEPNDKATDKWDEEDTLGPISHTCWTYWGHSGAPLFDANGAVVGLHTSWDDQTGMRRGVGQLEIAHVLNSIECSDIL